MASPAGGGVVVAAPVPSSAGTKGSSGPSPAPEGTTGHQHATSTLCESVTKV